MMRSSLAAASVALASLGAFAALTALSGPALAFEPPTAAEFFARFDVPDYVTVTIEDDGSVLLSVPAGHDGRVMFTLREDEVPAPGARSLSIDVTMVEDGGGWPEQLVGFGMIHGYHDDAPREPFNVGVVSPQGGGTLRIGSYTGDGFGISQSLGGSLGMGRKVTLTMSEEDGMLSFSAETGSGTSQSQTGNALVREAMAGGGRVGFILVSGGTYRVENLVVEAAD